MLAMFCRESIAKFLDRKGERKAGEWKRIGDGPNG